MSDRILKLVDELRDRLLKHGFKATAVTIIKERIEQATEAEEAMAYGFLLNFRDKYLKDYEEARKMCPPLVLTLYEAHGGAPSTYEEKCIFGAKKDMILAWKERPFILTRKPKNVKTRNQGTKGGKQQNKKGGRGTKKAV